LYGLGGPDRLPVAHNHLLQGGRYVAFDIGYWHREVERRKFRVSINGFHSPQLVMRTRNDPSRWNQSGLQVTKSGNPDGPILLIGNAPKSNAVGANGWSKAKAREIRAALPGRHVLYRPKPKRPMEAGVDCDGISDGPIEGALANASLVVCRHSNVAVDACRMGVPVVCEDGAAAAIYPQELKDYERQPPSDVRMEFLHRLAWWQWTAAECQRPLFWEWLEEALREIRHAVPACGD
jgi:hypothetical protein